MKAGRKLLPNFAPSPMVLSRLIQCKSERKKQLAVLIDPDDTEQEVGEVFEVARINGVELFLVGGSLVTDGNTRACVEFLKSRGAPMVVLFPGNEMQVVEGADAILFMSLISGRNPDFLIGKHVAAAPWVKRAGLEAIPTGYMLVESGKLTSAQYMSHTMPLPSAKPDIAAATALAGELLGMKLFYMDAGSGAEKAIPNRLIQKVAETIQGVLFVGGGIRNAADARLAWESGADVVVVGNGVFENINILDEISDMCRQMNLHAVRA